MLKFRPRDGEYEVRTAPLTTIVVKERNVKDLVGYELDEDKVAGSTAALREQFFYFDTQFIPMSEVEFENKYGKYTSTHDRTTGEETREYELTEDERTSKYNELVLGEGFVSTRIPIMTEEAFEALCKQKINPAEHYKLIDGKPIPIYGEEYKKEYSEEVYFDDVISTDRYEDTPEGWAKFAADLRLHKIKIKDGQLIDGTAAEIAARAAEIKAESDAQELSELRRCRQVECYDICDRAAWYDGLTDAQKKDIQEWRKAWLAVTETRVIPTKPDWL